MIIEIWTVLNPIIKSFIYLTALYSIGSVLFKFHFQKFFGEELNFYCKKIIKNNAFFGILISIVAFVSRAGNRGGDVACICGVEVID